MINQNDFLETNEAAALLHRRPQTLRAWAHHHSESERLAAEAERAQREGDFAGAEDFYCRAAQAEETALEFVAPSKQRTFGITAVSAGALWFKGRQLEKAESFIIRMLSVPSLPVFSKTQLKELLQTIRINRARSRLLWRRSDIEKILEVKNEK